MSKETYAAALDPIAAATDDLGVGSAVNDALEALDFRSLDTIEARDGVVDIALCDSGTPLGLSGPVVGTGYALVAALGVCRAAATGRTVAPALAAYAAGRAVEAARELLALAAALGHPATEDPRPAAPTTLAGILENHRVYQERTRIMFEAAEAADLPCFPPHDALAEDQDEPPPVVRMVVERDPGWPPPRGWFRVEDPELARAVLRYGCNELRLAPEAYRLVPWMVETGCWPQHRPVLEGTLLQARETDAAEALLRAHFPHGRADVDASTWLFGR